eukprot:c37541_g1_i1 orf=1-189(-)
MMGQLADSYGVVADMLCYISIVRVFSIVTYALRSSTSAFAKTICKNSFIEHIHMQHLTSSQGT